MPTLLTTLLDFRTIRNWPHFTSLCFLTFSDITCSANKFFGKTANQVFCLTFTKRTNTTSIKKTLRVFAAAFNFSQKRIVTRTTKPFGKGIFPFEALRTHTAFSVVSGQVIARRATHYNVGWIIVRWVAIQMMDLLGWFEGSSKLLFRYKAMFIDISVGASKWVFGFVDKYVSILSSISTTFPAWVIWPSELCAHTNNTPVIFHARAVLDGFTAVFTNHPEYKVRLTVLGYFTSCHTQLQ